MIIYFDFQSSQIKFLQQQNNGKYFVVDFLNDSNFSYEKAMQKAIENEEIEKILRQEKNYVILPNALVGITNLKVPFSKKVAEQYFKTKLSVMFNNSNLAQSSNIVASNKDMTRVVVCLAQKSVIKEIQRFFDRHGSKLKGISYWSEMVRSHAQKAVKFQNESVLILELTDYGANIIAIKNNIIVAHEQVEFNDDKIAEKYAAYVNNNYKKLGGAESLDNEINSVVIKRKDDADFSIMIDAIISTFQTAEIGTNFDKIIVINDKSNIIRREPVIKLDVLELEVMSSPFKEVF